MDKGNLNNKFSKMSSKTKEIVLNAANKTKEAAIVAGKKTKEVCVETKQYVQNKIEAHKQQKIDEHQNELSVYKELNDSIKKKIDEKLISDFISDLGESPVELTIKITERIKEGFPIPREQTILWADCMSKASRYGGIVVTNKGVFIKTFVKTIEEKRIKKEKRKVSNLLYFPYELFLDGDYINLKTLNDIDGFDLSEKSSFYRACENAFRKSSNIVISKKDYYSRYETLDGIAASATANFLKNDLEFTHKNGQYHRDGGNGFFAEQANTRFDKFTLKDAKVIGGDNAKNGADRLVNGIKIQSKYYDSAKDSVNAAFDKTNHMYRYFDENDVIIKLEVPRDQYQQAIEEFKKKIIAGQVPGVTDPNEAENIVVKGHFTYKQSVNMAKAGTIESLTYDITTGAVVASCAFSISLLINSFLVYRKTKDPWEAFICGLLAGGKTAILSLSSYVFIAQLSRTKVFESLMSKGSIQSGVVGATAGFVIFSIPETISYARKHISGAQYCKNLVVLAASTVGGATASAIAVPLGPAAVLAGGVAGGVVSGFVTSQLLDFLYEGDDKRHARLFNVIAENMFIEYLFDEQEIERFVKEMDKISTRKIEKLFKDLQSSYEQEIVIRAFLKPYFEKIVNNREKYVLDLKLLTA